MRRLSFTSLFLAFQALTLALTLGGCEEKAVPVAHPVVVTVPTGSLAAAAPDAPASAPGSASSSSSAPTSASAAAPSSGEASAPAVDAKPEAIPCKTVDDCWFDDAKKPMKRPATMRGKKVTPCKGGEHAPACSDGVCIVRAFKC